MGFESILFAASSHNGEFEKLVKRIPPGKFTFSKQIIQSLEVARSTKDERLLEALLLIASRDGLDSRYTDLFCSFLFSDWHEWHEDIVSYLEKTKDPQSVDCIYETSKFMQEQLRHFGIIKSKMRRVHHIGTVGTHRFHIESLF